MKTVGYLYVAITFTVFAIGLIVERVIDEREYISIK